MIIVQEKLFQITQITLENNQIIIRMIEDDHQTKEVHEISHKTDIVDETVETISIEITIQDQIQTDLNFRLIPVPIQILEKDITQLIYLETLHIKEIEINKTIEVVHLIIKGKSIKYKQLKKLK